jgi:ankyrin repeat protein
LKELLEAIEHDNLPKMRSLLEEGVDITKPVIVGEEYDLEEHDEVELLFYMILNKASLEAIELILEFGADISKLDDNGVSVLDMAVKYRRIDLIELCIDRGLDVNASSRRSGITPLMLASCFGDRAVVELLLANGAQINTKDNHGMSPKDYAHKLGQKRIEEFLESKGGLFNLYKE